MTISNLSIENSQNLTLSCPQAQIQHSVSGGGGWGGESQVFLPETLRIFKHPCQKSRYVMNSIYSLNSLIRVGFSFLKSEKAWKMDN